MKDKRNSIFTVANLVVALIAFALFLVAGISSYYMTMGEFVTAQLWVLYIALALVGAVTMFLHWYWFAILYYVGCALGWLSGRFIGGLKGEFAPTAGLSVTFALIIVFAVLGVILQMKSFKKRYDRRKEEKAAAKAAKAETEKLENQLLEAKKEKAAAQAALEAVVGSEQTNPTPAPAQTEKPREEIIVPPSEDFPIESVFPTETPQEGTESPSAGSDDHPGLFGELMDKLDHKEGE